MPPLNLSQNRVLAAPGHRCDSFGCPSAMVEVLLSQTDHVLDVNSEVNTPSLMQAAGAEQRLHSSQLRNDSTSASAECSLPFEWMIYSNTHHLLLHNKHTHTAESVYNFLSKSDQLRHHHDH